MSFSLFLALIRQSQLILLFCNLADHSHFRRRTLPFFWCANYSFFCSRKLQESPLILSDSCLEFFAHVFTSSFFLCVQRTHLPGSINSIFPFEMDGFHSMNYLDTCCIQDTFPPARPTTTVPSDSFTSQRGPESHVIFFRYLLMASWLHPDLSAPLSRASSYVILLPRLTSK